MSKDISIASTTHKHKTSHTSSSNEGKSIQSFSSSSRKDSTLSPAWCINYNPSTSTITVSCNSARLTDIDNKLRDRSVLASQSGSGVWFLSANLLIAKGAVFHIDPTDTKWLKINLKVASGLKTSAFYIDIHGSRSNVVVLNSSDPTCDSR